MIRLASFVERFTLLAGLALVLLLAVFLGLGLAQGNTPAADWYIVRVIGLFVTTVILVALSQGAALFREHLEAMARLAGPDETAWPIAIQQAVARTEYQRYLEDESGVTDPRR